MYNYIIGISAAILGLLSFVLTGVSMSLDTSIDYILEKIEEIENNG